MIEFSVSKGVTPSSCTVRVIQQSFWLQLVSLGSCHKWGTACGFVSAYISGFSAITATEVLVWLWNLLCSDKAAARIWVGCRRVNLEILDDPCRQPYVAAASACDKADSSWLPQCNRGRRTVRSVRLVLKVIAENHAVFVELLEVYRNDSTRGERLKQTTDTVTAHANWHDRPQQCACSSAAQTCDMGGACDIPRNSPWSQTHSVLCCQLIRAGAWHSPYWWVPQTRLLGTVVILHTTRCNTQKYYVTLTQCITFRMDRRINNDYFPIWHYLIFFLQWRQCVFTVLLRPASWNIVHCNVSL